jgi:hypothetical protein
MLRMGGVERTRTVHGGILLHELIHGGITRRMIGKSRGLIVWSRIGSEGYSQNFGHDFDGER